jgi:hypothetical protein
MTEPPRLLDAGTDFERGLLAAARRDAGNAEGLERVLAVLGGAATASPHAPTSATPGVLAGDAGAAMLTTWIGVAVALLVVGGGAAALSMKSAGGERRTQVAATLSPIATAPAVATPSTADTFEAMPLAATAPPAAAASAFSAPSVALSAPPVRASRPSGLRVAPSTSGPNGAASSMDAELALLGRVRALLAGGHPSDALRDLDAHDRGFPAPAFAEEAVVLRVDALEALGDHATAAAAARRLLAEDPTSAHAAHLLRVLRERENL